MTSSRRPDSDPSIANPAVPAAAASDNAREAVDSWMPIVYQELRRLAGRYLAHETPGQTLQPTALVHEAYLRLAQQRRAPWQDRAHFFRMAAKMMRRVLVDHYRGRHAQKRGDGVARITMVDDLASAQPQSVDLLELDAALERLASLDPQQATIVELRFFAGLTVEETAAALAVSAPTVKRHWALARAWLLVTLSGDGRADGR